MGEISGIGIEGFAGVATTPVIKPQEPPKERQDVSGEPILPQDAIKIEPPKPRFFPTDVPEIETKDQRDGLPVFDVEQDEFYQNMSNGRKRIRFKNGSQASEYMKKTRYNKPFFIKHGEYLRKIK
jgi:hypothetical protein